MGGAVALLRLGSLLVKRHGQQPEDAEHSDQAGHPRRERIRDDVAGTRP